MARFALFACGAALVSADKIKLGQDVDYPPYAFIDGAGVLQGFGKDIADGMTASCDDIEIEVVRAKWSDCWDGNGPKLGAKLEDGTLDACTAYTHTKGARNDWAEFSGGVLDANKAAGLLTLLVDGKPKVNGSSDLDGVTVVDCTLPWQQPAHPAVAGWAPTADTIAFVENKCASKLYSAKYIMKAGAGNDAAMKMLRDGDADAMFVYADQAKNYQCNADGKGKYSGSVATWDCAMWEGFGTDYAYVQTGQSGYVFNGTTLALAKKGSGVAEKLNPCLWKFMETKEYYDICVKHDFVESCYRNKHFPAIEDEVHHEYNKPTNEHSGDCSSGYCPCPGGASEPGYWHSESETSGAAGLSSSSSMPVWVTVYPTVIIALAFSGVSSTALIAFALWNCKSKRVPDPTVIAPQQQVVIGTIVGEGNRLADLEEQYADAPAHKDNGAAEAIFKQIQQLKQEPESIGNAESNSNLVSAVEFHGSPVMGIPVCQP